MEKEYKKRLARHIELYFWRHPSEASNLDNLNREFNTEYTEQEVLAIWGDEKISNYLQNRGIPKPDSIGIGLSERQMDWIEFLLDPSIAALPMSVKMKTFGITSQTHSAWMQSELFCDTLRIKSDKAFVDARALVLNSLVSNAVDQKDFRSQKLYLEMSGDYSPRSKVDVTHSTSEMKRFVYFIIDLLQSELEGEQLVRILSKLEAGFSSLQNNELTPAKITHLQMLEARSASSSSNVNDILDIEAELIENFSK